MPKKFTFPLAKALDWYRQRSTAEQNELQRMLRDIQMLDRLKDSLERRRQAEHEQLLKTNRLAGTDLRGLGNYYSLIRADLARLATERAHREKGLVEQRRKVITHRQKVRVLEELEKRRKTEWLHAVGVEEDSLASDLYLAALSREATEQES